MKNFTLLNKPSWENDSEASILAYSPILGRWYFFRFAYFITPNTGWIYIEHRQVIKMKILIDILYGRI